MGEVVVQRLQGKALEFFWPAIEGELDRLPHLWADCWTKEVLRDGAECGRFQVWSAGTKEYFYVVLFSQVVVYPAASVFQVFLAFGQKMDEMLPTVISTLEWFAKRNGCSRVEVVGRKAWERKLRAEGYVFDSVCVKRKLPTMETH